MRLCGESWKIRTGRRYNAGGEEESMKSGIDCRAVILSGWIRNFYGKLSTAQGICVERVRIAKGFVALGGVEAECKECWNCWWCP